MNLRTRAGSVGLALWQENPHSSQKEGLNGAPGIQTPKSHWLTPSAVCIAPAMESTSDFILSSLSASTITRASASVPE